jgi:beta-lactamase superfamily II metal-dependent hydrolase
MYRVGFGDFFLLSLKQGEDVAHILIDCGVHAKPTNSIDDAIAQLKVDTDSHLALVIMTHRHADHISGFAKGAKTFKEFQVDQVWMPWFEDPSNAEAVRIQAGITAVAQRLQMAFTANASAGDISYALMAGNILGFDIAGQSSNDIALSVLRNGFAKMSEVAYLKAGDDAPLPAALTNIKLSARILGPPTDPKLVSQMDGKNHQYLDQLDASTGKADNSPLFGGQFNSDGGLFGDDVLGQNGLLNVTRKIAQAQPDVIRAIAQQADNTINNQSIVVLFEFNGKKLLFAGDAQWGNWQNLLFGGTFGSPGHTALTDEAKAILKSIDFYKVGHHGSTNATPIDALDAMRDGIVAMCSTAVGAYGSEKNKSEVPRVPLMEALKAKTGGKLARSDQAPVPGNDTFPEPLDAAFDMPTHELFIDYHL